MQPPVALAQPSPPSGLLRAMIVLRSVELGWMLLSRAVILALPILTTSFGTSFFATYDRITSAVWLLFAFAGFALVLSLTRSLGSQRWAPLGWAVTALSATDALLGLVFAIEPLTGLNPLASVFATIGHAPINALMILLALAFDVLFWLLLVRLGSGCLSSSWTIVYAALRAVALLLSLPALLPPELYSAWVTHPSFGPVLIWSRLAFILAHGLTVILALARVARAAPAAAAQGAVPQPPAKASPQRDLLVGGLWLASGATVTLLSFSLASSAGGGRYLITTGAIAYGLVRVVRGLVRLGKE